MCCLTHILLLVPLLFKRTVVLQSLFVISASPACFDLGDHFLHNVCRLLLPPRRAVTFNVRSEDGLFLGCPNLRTWGISLDLESSRRLFKTRGSIGGWVSHLHRTNTLHRSIYNIIILLDTADYEPRSSIMSFEIPTGTARNGPERAQ